MNKALFALVPAMLLAGCFTVSETPYEATPMTSCRPAGTNVTLSVRGFEAMCGEIVAVSGYTTVFVPGRCGRHGGHMGFFEAVPTTSLVARRTPTRHYETLARDRFEAADFNVNANPAAYVVEVRFEGPYPAAEDLGGWRPFWWLGTLLTSDRAVWACSAKLKIHDNRTGMLLMTHDYEQSYAATGFSPLPLLGMLSYERTEPDYAAQRCLLQLTERTTADASAFLAAHR